MKKVIAVLLLLTMCIGVFAGCTETPAGPQADAGLEAAKEYLYTMYKDNKEVTSDSYSVVSQVRIDDVIYPITWTTDAPNNAKISAGENNMTVVTIEGSEQEITYKLTATLKNEAGQTVSVSFTHIIPAVKKVDGKTIVLSYPKENKYITGSHYLYTGKNKWQLNLTENKAEAIALEVIDNGDGSVTFKNGTNYLFCDATHVQFVSEQSDYTKFVLEQADTEGGYFIKCAVANYGGKAQYLEVYSGYLTCYGMGTDPSIYVFKLDEDTTGANGTVSGQEGGSTNPPATQPTTPSNPPATQPTTPSTPSTPSTTGMITTPETGKAYKLSMNNGKDLYFMGVINKDTTPWYMKSSENVADAIDVYLEAATGGYRLYFNINGTKTYLVMYKDGTHYSLKLTTEASTVYTWNSEYNTLVAMNEDKECFIGTSGTYNTFSCNTMDKVGTSYVAHLFGEGGSSTPSTPSTPTTPTTPSTPSTPTTPGTPAATLNMQGSANAVSHTNNQTVYAANGITYTNDKASSTTNNIAPPDFSARAYKSSTIKIEYTGMTAIVFTLDDHNSGQYLTGFDNMTVSGATISRNGDTVTITFASATNVFQSAELGAQVRIEKIDVYTA